MAAIVSDSAVSFSVRTVGSLRHEECADIAEPEPHAADLFESDVAENLPDHGVGAEEAMQESFASNCGFPPCVFECVRGPFASDQAKSRGFMVRSLAFPTLH